MQRDVLQQRGDRLLIGRHGFLEDMLQRGDPGQEPLGPVGHMGGHGGKLDPAFQHGGSCPEVGTAHREDLANAGELRLGDGGRGHADRELSCLALQTSRDNAKGAAGSRRKCR